MPIKECQKNYKEGYKWGDEGFCYTGKKAKKKARKQGVAITLSKLRRKGKIQKRSRVFPKSKRYSSKVRRNGYVRKRR